VDSKDVISLKKFLVIDQNIFLIDTVDLSMTVLV